VTNTPALTDVRQGKCIYIILKWATIYMHNRDSKCKEEER